MTLSKLFHGSVYISLADMYDDRNASTMISIGDICRVPRLKGHENVSIDEGSINEKRRINCGRGSEKCGILFVKFPFIFFGARSKLMGAWDTGTPLTSFNATLTTTTLIGPHLAMHYDDFSRVSR